MKTNLYFNIIRKIAIAFVCCLSLSSFAQTNPWELIRHQPATNAFHITENGNMLIADFLFEKNGGIYISIDKGLQWKKTGAADYNYNIFLEGNDYIFAGGDGTHIARSADDGVNWEILSYASAVEDVLGENTEYAVCYAMTFHNDKLFVGDFSGGGIVYSEDNGETWNKTDIASITFTVEGKEMVENFYNLVSFNGELYAYGVYFVFKYLPESNSWEVVRNDSNFMAVSALYQGKLCTGRSVMNDGDNIPFIVTFDENGEWGELPRPANTVDNNIRAMYATGEHLFVGMQMTGLYYTDNAGEDWYDLNEGIPYYTGTYFTPMKFQSDDEYIYLAAYEPPFATTQNSGVYRLSKKDLPTYDGINYITDSESAIFNGNSLIFNEMIEHIIISDINGRTLSIELSGNSVNVENLTNGIYIYSAIANGKKITGKFVK